LRTTIVASLALIWLPASISRAPVRASIGLRIVQYSTWSVVARSLIGLDGRCGRVGRRASLVVLLLRDEALAEQVGLSPGHQFRVLRLEGISAEIGFRLVQRGLEGPGIEREEQVAFLDGLALLEVDR
jgi:hypothetical protein